MRPHAGFLAGFLLAFLSTVPITAQDGGATCAEYNPAADQIVAIPEQTNSQFHITGYHYYNSQAGVACTYTDPSTNADQSCASQVSVEMSISGGDTGITTSAYHVNHVAQNQAGAGNPDGGSSATGQSAIAFESCTTNSCGFNVSVGPLTFPSESIWNGSQTYTANCPAEPNPNYSAGGGGSGFGGGVGCCGGGVVCGEVKRRGGGGGGVQGQAGAGTVCDPSTCDCVYASPIVVDTTGGGFHLTSPQAGVYFDIANTGIPVKIAWTAADSGNAFLALDRNGNGKIDDGGELFGDHTQQPASANPNGFLALEEFDKPENGGNGDGIIDARDAIFPHLLLWIDENHDGISQPNELHTLPELGVFSIALHYRNEPYTDAYGNWFHYRAAVNPDPADGQSKDGRWTYDVFFATERNSLPAKATAFKLTEPPLFK
jgi:hypothetical protein